MSRPIASLADVAARQRGRLARAAMAPVLDCREATYRLVACWIEGWLSAHHDAAKANRANDLTLFPVQRAGADWTMLETLFLEPARRDGLTHAAIGRLLGRSERSVRSQACRVGLGRPADGSEIAA